jgi:hypothetical protein
VTAEEKAMTTGVKVAVSTTVTVLLVVLGTFMVLLITEDESYTAPEYDELSMSCAYLEEAVNDGIYTEQELVEYQTYCE